MTQLPLTRNEALDAMTAAFRDKDSRPMDRLRTTIAVLGYHPNWHVGDLVAQLRPTGATEGYLLDLAASKMRVAPRIRVEATRGNISYLAYWCLARLPIVEQEDWLDKAINMPVDLFHDEVKKRILMIRERRREHARANPTQPPPQLAPFIRVEKDDVQSYLMFGNMQLDGANTSENGELIEAAAKMQEELKSHEFHQGIKCFPDIRRKIIWPE